MEGTNKRASVRGSFTGFDHEEMTEKGCYAAAYPICVRLGYVSFFSLMRRC